MAAGSPFARTSRDLAVDLGTANTLVAARGRGIVLEEPSVVAVRRTPTGRHGEVLAVGAEARRMLGRTPDSIVAMRPLREGVIADFGVTEQMLRHFVLQAAGRAGLRRPRIVICVPSGATEVERRAVQESARAAGAREVFLVPEPLAAALGADEPLTSPRGILVVDIGGGTSEVAMLSLGGIVHATSLRVAGDAMDQAIQAWVRERHGLLIGERTAEDLKRQIGRAVPGSGGEAQATVKGRDAETGIPRQAVVTADEMAEALVPTLTAIVEAIRETLQHTPPELASDLLDRGLLLAGGGALLTGLADHLSQATGLPVRLAPDPLRCVVMGAAHALEDPEVLERIAL